MDETGVVTPELLRKLLDYDPRTGAMRWKPRSVDLFRRPSDQKTWNARFAGRPAFTAERRGYLASEVFNRPYLAHRVAWAILHGAWPDGEIDHINGNRADNRAANLRDVTRAENNRNKRRCSRNKSGVTGVSLDTLTGRWRAQISVEGRAKFLGLFDHLASAIAARRDAEALYGFHENHGRHSSLGCEPT